LHHFVAAVAFALTIAIAASLPGADHDLVCINVVVLPLLTVGATFKSINCIAGLGIREWTCDDCGTVHDRDVNAAKNILRCGLTALAEGTSTSRLGSPGLPGSSHRGVVPFSQQFEKNDVSLLAQRDRAPRTRVE
jgi:Putative transposase DNA-binding domain